jgi:hypothetical protein
MSTEKNNGKEECTFSFYDAAIPNGPHCATLDVGSFACRAVLLGSGN